MRKVYVSGALTNIPNEDEVKEFYASIGKLCRKKGLTAYVPHLNGTDPKKDPDVSPSEVYNRDKREVRTSDLVIAYVGINSLGVGIELGWAEMMGIPIVLLHEKGEHVSRLPRGLPAVQSLIGFRNYKDALNKLHNFLEEKLSGGDSN